MENTMKTASTTGTTDTAGMAAPNGVEEVICVKTKLGTLIAYPSTDPAHPGIYIDLQRDGIPYMALIALVEYTEDDIDPKTGKELPEAIISRTWGDAMADEYTDKVSVQNIEKFFAEED